MRAGLYGRESKDKTKSVDDQLADGRAAVADRGWSLVDLYTDGVSASRFGRRIRKGWNRLLADLDEGLFDVIVTWEPSRADRDLTTWVQFVAKCRDTGVLVFLVGDDELLDPRVLSQWKRLIDGGVDAAMESEKTSKRTRRGVAKAAAAGGFHGDCPYGYERVIVGERQTAHGPKPLKEQRPHPEHAPIVREIFGRVAKNEALNAIVADLNARGVVAPAGQRWHRNTVRKMVLNVAYIGKRAHYDDVYDGTWEGLVTPEVFHAAGEILRDPKRRKSPPGRLKHLLSYLASTPCGGLVHYMGPQPGRNNHGRYHCVADGCVAAGQVEVDEVIARLVVKRVCRPDIRELFTEDDEPAQRARDELAGLTAKLAEATASFLKPVGGISADRLAEIEEQLRPMIADAQRRAVSRKAPMAMLALLDAAEFGEQKVRPEWDQLAVPAKREILKLLFADIKIGAPVQRLSRWSTPGERLAAATARISVEWRKRGQPVSIPHQPGPKTSNGGAKAQRRAKTSIELLTSHAGR